MTSNLYCQAFSTISGGHCTLHFSEIVWVGSCHSSGTAVACSLTEQCKNTCPCVGCHNASVCYHCTKKEIVFVYKFKKAKKKSSGRVLKLFGRLLIKLHLLISYSWPQHDLTLSPTHHHAYTDTSCSLSKQLCSHYFFILCLTYVCLNLQKKKQAYYREVNIALTFNSVHCLLMNRWWSVFKPRFYWS